MSHDRERLKRDVERLEHYLQWRERKDRAEREARAVRRRWWLRRAGVMLVVVIAIGLLTWLAQNRQATRHAGLTPLSTKRAEVSSAPREPAPASIEAAPPASAPVPVSPGAHVTNHADSGRPRDPAPAPTVENRRAPQQPGAHVDQASRARARSPRRSTASDLGRSAPPRESAAESTAAVGVSPPSQPQEPFVAGQSSTEFAAATTRESQGESALVATPRDSPAPSPSVAGAPRETERPVATPPPAPIASSGESAVVRPPAATDAAVAVVPEVGTPAGPEPPYPAASRAEVATPPSGRSRTQRVADWIKDESQEFRDGVKREIEEFRTGVDKVGRGLQWLGGKLRR